MAKTYDELKQIAVDIYDNKIFTDAHISEHDKTHAGMIFMPILLGAFSEKTDEEKKDIGLIYEYVDQAGPRSINGYPIFTSLQYLTVQELKTMNEYYLEYKKIKDEFKKNQK